MPRRCPRPHPPEQQSVSSMGRAKEVSAPRLGWFGFVAAGAALWGTDALFRRGLALELPAPALVFLEHVILVLVTLPVLWRNRHSFRSLDGSDWTALVLVGAGASALATSLFTAAFRYGDPTTPLLLQKVQPLVVVIAARLLIGERLLPVCVVLWCLVGRCIPRGISQSFRGLGVPVGPRLAGVGSCDPLGARDRLGPPPDNPTLIRNPGCSEVCNRVTGCRCAGMAPAGPVGGRFHQIGPLGCFPLGDGARSPGSAPLLLRAQRDSGIGGHPG